MTEGDTTRARLLDAAGELLAERGLASVTTRAIAERAGVNNALVHYHFGTKTALLAQAAVAGLGEDIAALAGLLGEAQSLGGGVAALLRWVGDLDMSDPRVGLLAELMIEALRDPGVKPVVAEALEDGRSALAAALAQRSDVGDELAAPLAALLTALLDGVVLHRLVDTDLDVVPWAAAAEAVLGQRGASVGPRRQP